MLRGGGGQGVCVWGGGGNPPETVRLGESAMFVLTAPHSSLQPLDGPFLQQV